MLSPPLAFQIGHQRSVPKLKNLAHDLTKEEIMKNLETNHVSAIKNSWQKFYQTNTAIGNSTFRVHLP